MIAFFPADGEDSRTGRELPFAEFGRFCHNLGPFSIGGETVMVDAAGFSRAGFAAKCEKAAHFFGDPLPTGAELC